MAGGHLFLGEIVLVAQHLPGAGLIDAQILFVIGLLTLEQFPFPYLPHTEVMLFLLMLLVKRPVRMFGLSRGCYLGRATAECSCANSRAKIRLFCANALSTLCKIIHDFFCRGNVAR